MHIAQIAPLYESVPPKMYGGTERVVFYLTEELVRAGHNVTVFATADSLTSGNLVPCALRSLRLDPHCEDPIAHHMVMLTRVIEMADQFDLIHFHTDYLHFPFLPCLETPSLSTWHNRLNRPELIPLIEREANHPMVSISESHRQPLATYGTWAGTVYHGLPLHAYSLSQNPEGYLAFVGRFSPEKGPAQAIAIAKKAGMKLKIAAKIDESKPRYYHDVVKPMMDGANVDYVGEIGEDRKGAFLSNARALVFPINWLEPFGMVLIEAMACGTPVVAFRKGSVPEIIEDGVSGFVVDNVDEAAEACKQVERLDRGMVRKCFERKFSSVRMAQDYIRIYERLMSEKNSMVSMARLEPWLATTAK